jgi:hypothetical protein
MKTNKILLFSPMFALMLGVAQRTSAQQLVASAAVPPAPSSVASDSVTAKPVAGKPLATNLQPVTAAPITWTVGSSVGPTPLGAAKPAHNLFGLNKTNKTKATYTGSNDLAVLPPAPVLDANGQQKLDWDRRPMFTAPEIQLQDKEGHPLFDKSGKPVFGSTPASGS